MMIYYRSYPYSTKATLISILANIGAMAAGVGAVVAIALMENKVIAAIIAILLAALAVFLFVYVGRKLTDKLAEKWSEENIRTKPGVAYQYVATHPDQYQRICEINPAFNEKYMINEKGRLVKRK